MSSLEWPRREATGVRSPWYRAAYSLEAGTTTPWEDADQRLPDFVDDMDGLDAYLAETRENRRDDERETFDRVMKSGQVLVEEFAARVLQ